jgi:hypothetical protein
VAVMGRRLGLGLGFRARRQAAERAQSARTCTAACACTCPASAIDCWACAICCACAICWAAMWFAVMPPHMGGMGRGTIGGERIAIIMSGGAPGGRIIC